MNRLAQDTQILALVKGEQRFVWLYVASERNNVLRSFGRLATTPDSGFTWNDAAVLAKRMREDECNGK